MVAYAAPPECAQSAAFQELLSAEIARTPNPDRPWRFTVTIHHDGDYAGTLKTETGVRELRAPTCDEVTAALALVIAMAQPELPAPKPPVVTPVEPVVSAVVAPRPVTTVLALHRPVEHDAREQAPRAESNDQWRIGLRPQTWMDGSQVSLRGATLNASVEVPWGFPKMQLELGVGALYMPNGTSVSVVGVSSQVQTLTPVMLGVIDARACPIDLPLGASGLSVLGCGHFAAAVTKGVATNGDYGTAGYIGGGGHLRWQSPWMVYVDAHFDGLYGGRIEGVSALMDIGGSIGIRL